MPPTTDSDQFRFLISCIRHSSAGKVDFEEVRKECNIISKGAAAKRYERLMKTHGITNNGVASGVKKETMDSDNAKKPKARPLKKRKLEEVNEDESDIDEPVKTERGIKGEVKYEDAIVKPECSYDDVSRVAPLHHLPSYSEPTSSSTNPPTDDDDEVLFVSATEKQRIPSTPNHVSDHRRSQAHSPMPAMHGVHSVDYAANMSFPQQLATSHVPPPRAPMGTMGPSSSFSYSFTPST
ncbi:hypothetical protein F5Y12DRAFT_714106 [Xylaria sp. FL1777]|nr:hypothetical protein F5Y12DRAFT_714106 [Xylaria sp. FL1777]